MAPTLQTERLLLRPLKNEDFEVWAAINADPEVMQYIGEVHDRENAHRSFCAALGHWLYRGYGPWAVEERATGKMVGRVGIIHWEGWPGLEVGYTFVKAAWGKGYATEAAARSLRYAHEIVGARGVISLIAVGNQGSIRVAEKLGARLDRVMPFKGKDVGVWVHRDP